MTYIGIAHGKNGRIIRQTEEVFKANAESD